MEPLRTDFFFIYAEKYVRFPASGEVGLSGILSIKTPSVDILYRKPSGPHTNTLADPLA